MNDTPLARPKLRDARRQALPASGDGLVRWSRLFDTHDLPALAEPAVPGMSLPQWAAAHHDEVHRRLLRHGAVLFRGFAVPDAKAFDACVGAVSGGALEYRFRASPRTQVERGLNVYTSTDYPAQESIFPHNEHAYSPVLPLHLFFFCETPPATGGETPVGSTRTLLARIDSAVRAAFARRKVMYVRNYGEGFGLPWQTVFQTGDRAEVEAYCASVGIRVEWKGGGGLRTRQVGPALLRHPKTGEAVWCNHATFFHELTLPASVRDALRAEFGPDDLPQNTFYGDGAPIEPEVIAHLQRGHLDAMAMFPWRRGDVLMLDNLLALHARTPFTGPRRVMVAMAHACRGAELDFGDDL
jgi:alpha-ketoglutarate-dependent taurine dioxygenase